MVSVSPEQDRNAREELFTSHLPLARESADRLLIRLPGHFAASYGEDLRQTAFCALWVAAGVYDRATSVPFWGYARTRVNGAMLDELRRLDTMPRRARALQRKVKAKRDEIEQRLGRTVDDAVAMNELGISPEMQRKFAALQPVTFVCLDQKAEGEEGEGSELAEVIADERCEHPSLSLDRDENSVDLEACLEKLSPVERSIVRMYYLNGIPLKAISSCLGLTESRICQVMDSTLQRLHGMMRVVQKAS